MELVAVVIVASVAVVAVLAWSGWVVRVVLEQATTSAAHAADAVEAATTVADDAITSMRDMLDATRVAQAEALETQRGQAVDLIRMVLHGDDTVEPVEPPTVGAEPPEAIIVDSDLEDPSDVWLSDDMLAKITPPLPVHEVDPATIRRSGQTGVIGE